MPLLELDLAIAEPRLDGPIEFEVGSATWALAYEMTFGEDGPTVLALGPDAEICLPKGRIGLAEFMSKEGMTVFFEKEAVLSPDGYLLQPDRSRMRFDPASLEVINWTGVNIRKESQGPGRDVDSVQHRVIQQLVVKGGEKVYHCGVAVQDKCPFKWLAEMSLGYAAMVSDEDVVGPAQGRRVGGPSASRYFLTVALWIPNSRSIARSDIPLRLAF